MDKVEDSVIQKIKSQIEQKRLELRELETALNVLSKFGIIETRRVLLTENIQISDEPISLDDLGVEENQNKDTLKAQIMNLVTKLGNQEFTVAHIDAALKRYGVIVNGKSPRSRIAMTLGKLEDEKLIKRTFKGVGNNPHKFVLIQKEEVDEL